jgi:ubiquinone/menaquinone biosynthesis C-methylase UbiE
MTHRVCPWWLGYVLACPWRRWFEDPGGIVGPYVREGMTVLEPGPGMGFFTLEMARRVGAAGRVVAVDIQPRMLRSIEKRAAKAGLAERVETRVAQPDSLGVDGLAGQADFALAYAMVHEVPDPGALFRDIAQALKPGAALLLAEPSGHVNATEFERELALAAEAGLATAERPPIRRNHAALLRKS